MTNIATSPRLLEGRPQRIVSTQFLDAGGLVQVSHFSVLPDIGAGVAAAAVLASMVPLLVIVWRHPHPAQFACFATLASLNSVRELLCFGWALYSALFYCAAFWLS